MDTLVDPTGGEPDRCIDSGRLAAFRWRNLESIEIRLQGAPCAPAKRALMRSEFLSSLKGGSLLGGFAGLTISLVVNGLVLEKKIVDPVSNIHKDLLKPHFPDSTSRFPASYLSKASNRKNLMASNYPDYSVTRGEDPALRQKEHLRSIFYDLSR